MDAERCVCCGEVIPEGRMVCPNCERGLVGKPEKAMEKKIRKEGGQNVRQKK